MKSYSEIQHFNELFNEYNKRFIRFAMGYVQDLQIAEDFVSEAFTAYWENKEQLLDNSKPQAYILSIVRNKCLNYLNHLQVRRRIKEEINDHAMWKLQVSISTLEACDPNLLFSKEIEQIIQKTLEKLPHKTKQVFVLSRFEGRSYKEIAEKMDLSVKSIEFHISKALAQFRISLKDFVYLLPFIFLFI